MALPLIPLILGGLFAGDKIKRGIDRRAVQRDRSELQQGVQSALGSAPGLGLNPGQFGSGGLENLFQSAGSGLLADPNSQQNQLQFAANIMGLPGGGQFGQSLIEQSLGFGQRDTEQAALFQQQDKDQDNLFTFNREENRLDRGQRLTLAENKAEALRTTNEARAQALIDANVDPFGLGNQPADTRAVMGADGIPQFIPLKGSVRYNDAVSEIQTWERAVTDADNILQSIKLHGSEFMGIESGQQSIAYNQILAHMAKLSDLGVLQKSDIEFLQDALPDPSSLDGMFTSQPRLEQSYESVISLFQVKVRDANRKYSTWGIGSELEDQTPTDLADIKADQQITALAEAVGLTRTGRTARHKGGQLSLKQKNSNLLGGPRSQVGITKRFPGRLDQ